MKIELIFHLEQKEIKKMLKMNRIRLKTNLELLVHNENNVDELCLFLKILFRIWNWTSETPTVAGSLGSQPVVLAPPRSQNGCPDPKSVVCASVVAPPGWGRDGSAPLRARFALGALRSAPPFPGPSQAPQPTPAGQLF